MTESIPNQLITQLTAEISKSVQYEIIIIQHKKNIYTVCHKKERFAIGMFDIIKYRDRYLLIARFYIDTFSLSEEVFQLLGDRAIHCMNYQKHFDNEIITVFSNSQMFMMPQTSKK